MDQATEQSRLANIPMPDEDTVRVVSPAEMAKLGPKEKPLAYISEADSTAYPLCDNLERFVSLRELADARGSKVYFSHPYKTAGDPYQGEHYLRESVAQALLRAAESVHRETRGEITFLIDETHRPFDVQQMYFERHWKRVWEKQFAEGQPDWIKALDLSSLSNLGYKDATVYFADSARGLNLEQQKQAAELHRAVWEVVTQGVADPKLVPPHTTGGAVDVLLCDAKTGKSLHLGESFALDTASHTFTRAVPEAEQAYRRLLYRAMTEAGFTNLPTEYWHYSIGDQYSAAATGKPAAVFSSRTSEQVLAEVGGFNTLRVPPPAPDGTSLA